MRNWGFMYPIFVDPRSNDETGGQAEQGKRYSTKRDNAKPTPYRKPGTKDNNTPQEKPET